ncbi:Hypothetical predicted protein [Lecanosticta acicola]|uniref:PD-(D/E)XK nuclease-like domain-containing protein n=1 Tax=Lecanosticta acicola TaxID=111012 RepID=A0AAI8Z9P7_9PEZI|nr:Hypothetical predicted protein [Lecanosticta acicola]
MSARSRCLAWLAQVEHSHGNPSSHQTPLFEPETERELSPHDSAWLSDENRPLARKRKRATEFVDTSRGFPAQQRTAQLEGMAQLHPEDNDSTPTQAKRRKRRMGDDAISDSGTGATQEEASSQRSTSPVKQINRLYSLETPVVDAMFSDELIETLPPDMRDLFAELERCQRLRTTVPAQFKPILREAHPMRSIWREENIWKEDNTSETPTLDEMISVAREASELAMYNELEASWNSQCHGPLLVLARRLCRHRDHIRVANITSARPHRRLIPSVPAGGKMVDFGILLRPQDGDALSRAYTTCILPEDDGVCHFNHSSSQQIARNPLAISIETKRADTGGDSAKLQLRLWAATQMKWLAEVRRISVVMAPHKVFLPLLVAIGSRWHWFFAAGEFDAQTGALQRTVVYEQQFIGDVGKLEGAFAVLEALIALMDWMQNSWRPWLETWLGVGRH